MKPATGNEAYAIHFDASCCTGCKTCQAACKDKNRLPAGILWRRVYEIAGGEWYQRDSAWISDVFAYYISVSCNHCGQPICVEVCPAGAFRRRADGIVLLNPEKCLGCKYCSWACPYGAPQYDEKSGRMTKCSFCEDLVDIGLMPACVTSCPMRALDFGTLRELESRYGGVRAVYPLPEPELTDPRTLLTPHPDARRATPATASIGNREEVNAP